jgi:hypothetical protein
LSREFTLTGFGVDVNNPDRRFTDETIGTRVLCEGVAIHDTTAAITGDGMAPADVASVRRAFFSRYGTAFGATWYAE